MCPQLLHRVWIRCGHRCTQQNALDDTSKVSQVEQVVGLGGSWQELQHRLLVDTQCGLHQLQPSFFTLWCEPPGMGQFDGIKVKKAQTLRMKQTC